MPSSSEPAAASTLPTAVTWQQIDDLLQQLAEFAKQRPASNEFAATLCQRVRQTLQVAGCAVWLTDSAGTWLRLAYDGPNPSAAPRPGQSSNAPQVQLAQFVLDAGRKGAIEVYLANNAAGQATIQGVVEALAELAGDFFRTVRLEELAQEKQTWHRFSELAARLHRELDPAATAFAIANDGRTWLGCDRVSVLQNVGGTPTLLAITGVDRVERRAPVIEKLEQLVAAVSAWEEGWWWDGNQELPSELDAPLHAFLEHAPAKLVGIAPLRPQPSEPLAGQPAPIAAAPLGWLVVESFVQEPHVLPLRDRLASLVPQATTALANAVHHRQIPWSAWFDRWRTADRGLVRRRGLWAALCIGAVASALALIPADFKVTARGELQPLQRREIFAPADGVIDRVSVEHGQEVTAGTTLVELKQAELYLELARVAGGLATSRKKLAAAQALQFELPKMRDHAPERMHQLTAEVEELKALIAGLEAEQTLLHEQLAKLRIVSPLAGRVLTWNVEPLLSARPVTRGQHLLTVANDAGPWELDLAIPDDRMGHVLNAQQSATSPLPVSFVVATDPQQPYRAQLTRVAQIAETDAAGQSSVSAVVELPSDAVADPRPGAEVIAQIDCGRRSLGYVWFHDLFDAMRQWLSY